MKKTYIQPSMTMAVIATTQFVCASKGVKGRFEEEKINYGGVDAEGGLDAAAVATATGTKRTRSRTGELPSW